MTHKIISKSQFEDSLTQYGDGIFETMLAVENQIHHWDYHWQRLQNSCRRLQIRLPQRGVLSQQLQAALNSAGNAFSVVKMIVSRGAGLRGYRSLAEQPCYVQFRLSPYSFSPTLYQGIALRVCQTRLAHQPLLAGMKHLNRLEYVMARRESDDKQFDEGLLLNYDNLLIEGLISNVFIIKKQHIYTPDLSGSGVAGTMRAYLLKALPEWGYNVGVKALSLADLAAADEVFLSNATAGIMPVAHIDNVGAVFSQNLSQTIRQQVNHPCSKQ